MRKTCELGSVNGDAVHGRFGGEENMLQDWSTGMGTGSVMT